MSNSPQGRPPAPQPSPPPPPARRPVQPAPVRDTKSSLYEAALAAVEDRAAQARAKATQRPVPRRRFPWVPLLLVIGAAGVTLLVIRPSWLAGPRILPRESPGVAAASLRLTLLRERDAVFDYVRRTGRTPTSLVETGSKAHAIDYQRSGGGFILFGHAGDSLIVLRSTDSAAAFLGESLLRLKNRGVGAKGP